MASHNRTRSNQNQQNNDEGQSGGGWLVPAVLGAAIGAGLTYFLNKSQSQNCHEQSQSNSTTCGSSNYEAAPRGCCSICRDDYEATITLRCGHILHRDCYEELKRNSRGAVLCPLCRKRAE
uniref:CSON003939 protein n=1 Tax=Culicoides sonorensis TaxID=179676 RepID=A0A336MMN0_CULSO